MEKLVVIIAPAIKAVVVVALLAALDVAFVKSLVLVIVSASISGAFLLVATQLTIRNTRSQVDAAKGEVKEEVKDVKRALGISNREGD